MKRKRKNPAFKSEAEEARLSDEDRARLPSSKARMVSIRLPEADIRSARKQAAVPFASLRDSLGRLASSSLPLQPPQGGLRLAVARLG